MESYKPRLLFSGLTNDPYWINFLQYLSSKGKYEIFVAFSKKYSKADRFWKMDGNWFQSISVEQKGRKPYLNYNILHYIQEFNKNKSQIKQFKPDLVIINGYALIFNLLISRWAKKNRVPVILRGDSNYVNENRKPFLLRMLKRSYMKWFSRNVDRIWTMGVANEAYWRYYGMDQSRFRDGGYYPVNTESIQKGAEVTSAEQLEIQQKNKWVQPIWLYVGRFVKGKGLLLLVQAFVKVRMKSNCTLILIGDGPEKDKLLKEISASKVKDVHLLGPKRNDELPVYYGLAHCYIQPSLFEPAGIVIHEALAAGTPVIASDACGYAQTMIVDGWNGYKFKSGNVDDLAEKMGIILNSPHELPRMKINSKSTAKALGYGKVCSSLDALYEDLKRGRS